MYQYSPTQIKWALRRLMLGVPKKFKVIEIGSGGNPTPKSDLLVEPYLDGEHENSKRVVVDRPTFVMKAEDLPFRNKAFDYSICFHVLEHTDEPETFVNTLQRISNAGYIETPTPLNELFFPYDFHMTAVARKNKNSLKAYGLASYDDSTLQKVRESLLPYLESKSFLKFYRQNPNLFNTVLRWQGTLDIELIGTPKTASNFETYEVPAHPHHEVKKTLKQKISPIIRNTLRFFGKKNIDIASLLMCTNCESLNINTKRISEVETEFNCKKCGKTFIHQKDNIFRLINR